MTVYKFVLTLFFSLAFASVFGQKEKDFSRILKRIREHNVLEFEFVGPYGSPNYYFQNYQKLKRKATIPQLIELTSDTNAVLACYASWALIDKSFNNLPSILIKFLNNNSYINNSDGPILSHSPLYIYFYDRYWNSINEKATDKTLFALDSIILYHDKFSQTLIRYALENRVYPDTFIKRIEYLAFAKANRDAIIYLKKLNQKAYDEPIKQATLKYFEETDFSKVIGLSFGNIYFETLKDLLNYDDDNLKKSIIKKLKNDNYWESLMYPDGKKFIEILEKHNIQLKDIHDCFSHTVTIKGRILGYGQKGLNMASLYLFNSYANCQISNITHSDKDGNFVFKYIPIGAYDLGITYPGYGDSTLTSIKVSNDTIISLSIDYLQQKDTSSVENSNNPPKTKKLEIVFQSSHKDHPTELNKDQIYILKKQAINADFNMMKLNNFDAFISTNNSSLRQIFEPVNGNYNYYQFVSTCKGENLIFPGDKLKDTVKTFHDILIVKTNQENKIVDAYQYTLECGEYPCSSGLFKCSISDVPLIDGMSIGRLKFLRMEVHWKSGNNFLEYKGIIKLKK